MAFEIRRELWVPFPLPDVFDFFAKAENLERITPPWLNFRIRTPLPIKMEPGTQILYSLRVHGLPIQWLTTIEKWNPPYEFVDVQTKGPYKLWHHTHRFTESGGGTLIEDHVRYELPFGFLGRLVHRFQVARDVETIFAYRAAHVEALIADSISKKREKGVKGTQLSAF